MRTMRLTPDEQAMLRDDAGAARNVFHRQVKMLPNGRAVHLSAHGNARDR